MLTKSVFPKRGVIEMNFYNKKVRKVISVVVITIVVAMIASAIIPYIA